MATDLLDKRALVTGSARGIGRATALALAARGAHVLAHQRTAGDSALVAEIVAAGGQASVVVGDLETPAGVAQLAESTTAALGGAKLDILVHNAGIAAFSGLADTDAAGFDRLFAVNVRAPFLLTQALEPHISDNGRIIVLSSVVGRTAFPGVTPYAMTKGAVNVFVLNLAQQLGSRGITVNAVSPGPIDTDMSAGWLRSGDGAAEAISMQALKRLGQPGDVAEVVAFIASPAAGWITGQDIDASGGTKWYDAGRPAIAGRPDRSHLADLAITSAIAAATAAGSVDIRLCGAPGRVRWTPRFDSIASPTCHACQRGLASAVWPAVKTTSGIAP